MKLWLKQTLICTLIILLTFCGCMYYFVIQQTQQILDTASTAAQENLSIFHEHLMTLERTASLSDKTDKTTVTALIQYTFANYARLLQGRMRTYSLVMDNSYLYNTTVYDPLVRMPMETTTLYAQAWAEQNGTPLLISAQNTTILGFPLTIYAVEDVSDVIAQLDRLTFTAQLALIGCLLLTALLLPLTIRRTLSPLHRLSLIGEQIAKGNYALRAQIVTRDEVGEVSAAFDHMADTVERKILALEEAARRREMLLGALTHEIKTPMTAIIGFSDSLLSMPLNEEKRLEAAHEIYEAALRTERLSRKMMQLITMADSPLLLKRQLNTEDFCHQISTLMASALSAKDMTLHTQLRTNTLFGDEDLLTCLTTNLIDNAIKASAAGQALTLRAEETQTDYTLSIHDAGSGIPADKLALVTEPFYRVDKARSRRQGGAGLGLALCQQIAQAHGGKLLIESTVGIGTTITMVWPKEDVHV